MTIVTDPADYSPLLEEIADGTTRYAFRQKMAAKAYPAGRLMMRRSPTGFAEVLDTPMPRHRVLGGVAQGGDRYGETRTRKPDST